MKESTMTQPTVPERLRTLSSAEEMFTYLLLPWRRMGMTRPQPPRTLASAASADESVMSRAATMMPTTDSIDRSSMPA